MKKFLKFIITVILAIAVVFAGVGVGYIIKEKGLLNGADEQTNGEQPTADVEKIYKDYFDSAEAEKYFHLLEDGDGGLKYSGDKELEFFDIDNDGLNECFLRIDYFYENVTVDPTNIEEQICLFDIDGENVRLVKSTGLCAPYRTGEKLRLIKNNDDTYNIFWYLCEANKIREGSVYSYDGKTLKLEKSFFADIYPIIYNEKTFFVSTTNDLFDESSELLLSSDP